MSARSFNGYGTAHLAFGGTTVDEEAPDFSCVPTFDGCGACCD